MNAEIKPKTKKVKAQSTAPTILVVEDDEFLSRVLVDKLEKEKFNVLTAFDGEDAVVKIQNEHVNLVILDIIMPKKTGFDVIDEVKSNPTTKDIPIILLSNLGQESDIARAKEKGVLDYFVKSNISLASVVEKVNQYIHV